MAEREGVIQFQLDFHHEDCIGPELTGALTGWRHVLHRLGLIGQEEGRYHGLGFGNISCRLRRSSDHFLISGSQTGRLPLLEPRHYALVSHCDPVHNSVRASGLTRPSSEAMTHGQLYQLDQTIGAVVHAHCPEIWDNAATLALPLTPRAATYGSPAMAEAVVSLFADPALRAKRLFVMGGHEDGVVSFGRDLAEAAMVMIDVLAQAVVS